MGLSLACLRKSARLSDMILKLEERSERDPDEVHIEEISAKRSEMLTLESIVQGQLPIIDTIITQKDLQGSLRAALITSGGHLQTLNQQTGNWNGWSAAWR